MLLAEGKQRKRNAQFIVEILLGLVGFEFAAEHCVDHFFGGGFAHAAGDADYGDIVPHALVCRDGAHCRKRGFNHDAGHFAFVFRLAFGQAAYGAVA